MNDGIWTQLHPYFTRAENWGDPDRISGLLLLALYQIRIASGWPMIIHCGYEARESGCHRLGLAADFHFAPPGGIPLQEQALKLEAFLASMQLSDFVGLGLYTAWHNPGFHLDVRGRRARWAWHGNLDGAGRKIYVAWDVRCTEYMTS